MEELFSLIPSIAYCNKDDWTIICRASFMLENGEDELFNLTSAALLREGYIPEFLMEYGSVKETCSLKYFFNMKNITLVQLAQVLQKYDEDKYHKWHKNRVIQCAKNTNIHNVYDIAKLIYEYYSLNYVFYNKDWYVRMNNEWEKITTPDLLIDEVLMKIPCLSKDVTLRNYVKRTSKQNHVKKEIEEFFWVPALDD